MLYRQGTWGRKDCVDNEFEVLIAFGIQSYKKSRLAEFLFANNRWSIDWNAPMSNYGDPNA